MIEVGELFTDKLKNADKPLMRGEITDNYTWG